MSDRLDLADWRRRVAELYAVVRRSDNPAAAHELWCSERDNLFRTHPQSPLPADDPLRDTGLPYWPYDPTLRLTVPLEDAGAHTFDVPTSTDGTIHLTRMGRVTLLGQSLDVWWLTQYGGGIFVPLRDGTAGAETYGAGRYLLDTAKGADLGGTSTEIVIDLNFAYHPSCRYNPRWECPLAPDGNRISTAVRAGERLSAASPQ